MLITTTPTIEGKTIVEYKGRLLLVELPLL